MTREERKQLRVYFDPKTTFVAETRSKKRIRMYLKSRMSICWSNGPIDGTPFYKLCHTSPMTARGKAFVYVCRTELTHETPQTPHETRVQK